ncbi:MAG: hypothetical protein IJS03_08730 [Eubacterium sp.]|nr:hypothetical protein [Eubacterium sp.]
MSNSKQSEVAFLMMKNWREQLDLLTDEQRGILLKAIYDYQCDGTDFYTSDGVLNILWISIKQIFNINNKKYEETCAKNRQNIAKRWNNNTTVSSGISKNTKNTDIDINKDNDKVIDKDIVNDVDIEIVEDTGEVTEHTSPAVTAAYKKYISLLSDDFYNTPDMLNMDTTYTNYTNSQLCALYELVEEEALERYLNKAADYSARDMPKMIIAWAVEDGKIIKSDNLS